MEQKDNNSRPEKLPRTLAPRTTDRISRMEYVLANLQGIGRREQQEDAFGFGNALDHEAIAKQGLMIVVADGMGGMQGGKLASETATASILESFRRFDLSGDIPWQLERAVFDAGTRVLERLNGSGGSTAVAGLIWRERLYFTSVGDSYLFLMHDRELVRLNRSQNVYTEDCLDLILGGELDRSDALRNPEKDAITQFLGMPGLDETDSLRQPLRLHAGDVLLFCSDGIGGFLPEKYIEECLLRPTPEQMCAALEEGIRTIDHRYQDNYTALVVQCRK